MTPGFVSFPKQGVRVQVEILETPEERAQGLMFRTSLPEYSGALFWMGRQADHSFFMKNTRIPLDLLFCDNRGQIVGILTLTTFDESSRTVGRNSSTILEVNGGWAARHGVQVGDFVTISLA